MGPKYSKIIQKILKQSKRFQKNPKDSKRIQKIPKESKRFQKNQKESKRFQRNQKDGANKLRKLISPPSTAWRFKELEAPQQSWLGCLKILKGIIDSDQHVYSVYSTSIPEKTRFWWFMFYYFNISIFDLHQDQIS